MQVMRHTVGPLPGRPQLRAVAALLLTHRKSSAVSRWSRLPMALTRKASGSERSRILGDIPLVPWALAAPA